MFIRVKVNPQCKCRPFRISNVYFKYTVALGAKECYISIQRMKESAELALPASKESNCLKQRSKHLTFHDVSAEKYNNQQTPKITGGKSITRHSYRH